MSGSTQFQPGFARDLTLQVTKLPSRAEFIAQQTSHAPTPVQANAPVAQTTAHPHAHHPALELDYEQLYTNLEFLQTKQSRTALVVGAGAVGSSLALSLLQAGFRVLLLDAKMPKAYDATNFDLRLQAVNYHNVELLTKLGAWQYIVASEPCMYDTLSLYSEELAENTFQASEIELPYLGYMVENAALVTGTLQACATYGDKFSFLAGWEVAHAQLLMADGSSYSISNPTKLTTEQQLWQVEFTNGVSFQTSVVLAADGAKSYWRNAANIGVNIHSYPTKCLLIYVTTNPDTTSKYQHHTWQYINHHGPQAWLPVDVGRGVLCWYDQTATIDQLQQLSPETLKAKLLSNFPTARIGTDFTVEKYGNFALARQRANSYWSNNVLLFGDAGHTVSPLAGQGLNLGYQDVRCFDEFINSNLSSFDQVATRYARERYLDNSSMQEFLSLLHHSYISASPVASVVRKGINKLTNIDSFKRYALNYACGNRDLLKGVTKVVNNLGGLLSDPSIRAKKAGQAFSESPQASATTQSTPATVEEVVDVAVDKATKASTTADETPTTDEPSTNPDSSTK